MKEGEGEKKESEPENTQETDKNKNSEEPKEVTKPNSDDKKAEDTSEDVPEK